MTTGTMRAPTPHLALSENGPCPVPSVAKSCGAAVVMTSTCDVRLLVALGWHLWHNTDDNDNDDDDGGTNGRNLEFVSHGLCAAKKTWDPCAIGPPNYFQTCITAKKHP